MSVTCIVLVRNRDNGSVPASRRPSVQTNVRSGENQSRYEKAHRYLARALVAPDLYLLDSPTGAIHSRGKAELHLVASG
jgi:uncharacterized protein YbjT (DUF2867 family)